MPEATIATSQRGRLRSFLVFTVFTVATCTVVGGGPAVAAPLTSNGTIAFTSGRSGNPDIYKVNPDGSNLVRLTTNSSPDSSPEWSPDGTRIAFVSERDGNKEIYLMSADGSDVVNVTQDAAEDRDPSWSPDGSRLAFASTRAGQFFEVFTIRLTDASVTRITTSGCHQPAPVDPTVCGGYVQRSNSGPSWSPDGARIAFHRGEGTGANVRAINIDGSNDVSIGGGGHSTQPDWSPDGSRIVWADHSEGSFVANADGSNLHLLPATTESCPTVTDCHRARILAPAWAPDGLQLVGVAVQSTNASIPRGIYFFTPEGSSATPVTADASDNEPAWQPVAGVSATTTSTTTTTIAPPATSIVRPLVVRGDTWYLRNSQTSGSADTKFIYGNPTGDTPITGDWDGDGSVTPGVVRGGIWFLRNANSTGAADLSFVYGNPGDIPVAGDWDGNGTVTPGVVRNSTFYLRNSNTEGTADVSFIYGDPGDIPIVGDWDSTKTDTPGVVRNGFWHLRNSNTQGVADTSFAYGNPGDKPLAGDWDGKASGTPGVTRGNTWFLRNSNTAGVADVTFSYGDAGDKPLTWRA